MHLLQAALQDTQAGLSALLGVPRTPSATLLTCNVTLISRLGRAVCPHKWVYCRPLWCGPPAAPDCSHPHPSLSPEPFSPPATMDLSAPPPRSLRPTSALPASGLIPCPHQTTVSWARPTAAASGEYGTASSRCCRGRAAGREVSRGCPIGWAPVTPGTGPAGALSAPTWGSIRDRRCFEMALNRTKVTGT